MFKILKTEGKARRGEFSCAHGGTVQTPVFMNVGTQAAIKGGVSALDLKNVGCQIELSNTYHLHLRPGDKVVRQMGGLHKFMNWDGPILTDSGGFQVFSLASLRKIKEEGVTFASHIDGHRIFMGPEESMQIQSNLGSDIAMAFDECVENPARYEYAKASVERTLRWLQRCKVEHDRLNSLPDTVNPHQMLFGINQGATFADLRAWHMQEIAKIDCDGYAIGGLAVGEPAEIMYEMIDVVEPFAPKEKPRYLMGVGTPSNIIEAVARGVDFFDCVMPSRNGRHGKLFTWEGTVNIMNEKYITDDRPISESCNCPVCRSHSRAYLRHLFKADEVLALRLAGESWFSAVCHSFTTMATGGFSIYDTSLAGASKAVMWIITVFSFLAGVNFSLMFLSVRGRVKEALRSEELWIYVGVVTATTLLLCVNLWAQAGVGFHDSITDAAFQTVTIITTTGFATVDFALWPTFCRMALVMLMFTGGCAGSTSGGIKISRVAILCKSLKRELKRLAHPHHVSVLKVDGQAVEERVVSSAGAFIAAYLLVLLAGALVVSWDNYGFQESFAASLTCISNVGPGLGILGPMENFSILSPLSKLVLSLEMLMGRLELMPLLALFLGSTWRD